jgi:ABC-type bacteriocin/lantibiotic exporter with double-glycine peptidase domain
MSHGEQQLLALARAILRKRVAKGRCILILDEATSNLDSASEAIVQKVVKEEFKDNTVITVAHRLDTIKDADGVLLLEKGEVVKVGSPAEVWALLGVKNDEAPKEELASVVAEAAENLGVDDAQSLAKALLGLEEPKEDEKEKK